METGSEDQGDRKGYETSGADPSATAGRRTSLWNIEDR